MQIGHTKNAWHFEEEGGYPTASERRLMAPLTNLCGIDWKPPTKLLYSTALLSRA